MAVIIRSRVFAEYLYNHSCYYQEAGGINSTDAAQVNAWGVGPRTMILKWLGSLPVMYNVLYNEISSGDAAGILLYFVQAR